MTLTSANYIFLPWVRQGAASGIKTPDMSANQPGVVSVKVMLGVNNAPPDIERQVRLYGPGDVTGIDPTTFPPSSSIVPTYHGFLLPLLQTPSGNCVPGFV